MQASYRTRTDSSTLRGVKGGSANLTCVKRYLWIGGAVAVVVILAIGITQIGGGTGSGAPKSAGGSCTARGGETGVAPAIAALHREACRLLPGGPAAFKSRLASLHGHPVVVNKWASWCAPCRTEFPYFQRAERQLGARVAFVGVDSNDNRAAASKFLTQFPVQYPSYDDPSNTVAQVFNGVLASPTTAFYDPSGKLKYIHQGQYESAPKLISDIHRYAMG